MGLLVALMLTVALVGCVSLPKSPFAYEDLVARIADGELVEIAALRRAFLARPDFDDRLRELVLLEGQVLATMDDRPLRLGAVGSAILDQYYGSLAGHQALARFYAHVEAAEQAGHHQRWIEAIRADIAASAEGTPDDPYPVLFTNQATAFLATRDLAAVGSSYHETELHPLMLWVTARPEAGRVQNVYFDFTDTYLAYAAAVRRDESTVFPVAGQPKTCAMMGMCEAFSTMAFLHILASGEDDAAQVLIGRMLASQGERYEDASNWLFEAARADNAIANMALARVCLEIAFGGEVRSQRVWLERAERRYLLAIAAGFDEAMVQLAVLYLTAQYGQDKVDAGLQLLVRAADLDNVRALLDLAELYATGSLVAPDRGLAEEYYVRAAELDDEAKLGYARFLLSPAMGKAFNDRAYQWLRVAAKARKPHAMLLIARLFHNGTHVDQSTRRARAWLRKAVKTAPDDASVVNDVAWTLTVTRLPKLHDARYALKIMERVMADDSADARRNPAYLDTWAAAYAANGDFERAISIQEQAIAIKQANADDGRNYELGVLLEHLAALRAGERISDETVR